MLCQAGHVCGDSMDLINGKPTGSIRVSFGFSSTLSDARHFLRFVYECFVDDAVPSVADDTSTSVAESSSADVACGISASAVAGIIPGSDRISGNVAESVSASVAEDLSTTLCDNGFSADVASDSISTCTHVADNTSGSVAVSAAASVNDSRRRFQADRMYSSSAADDDCNASGEMHRAVGVMVNSLKLVRILVYPVKSCAAVEVMKQSLICHR